MLGTEVGIRPRGACRGAARQWYSWAALVASCCGLAGAEHEGRGFCLGNCEACHELLEELPRAPLAAAGRHLDAGRAGPEELMAFVAAPEVCKVQELFPMSVDRELWSLAALKGGAAQLGFPGATSAVRAGTAACTAVSAAAVGAYEAALRAAGGACAAPPSAGAAAPCDASAVREAVLQVEERWRSAWRAPPAGRSGPAHSLSAPMGNETPAVLAEYAARVREAFAAAAALAAGSALGPGSGAGRPAFGAYRALTGLALDLARLARQMVENLRLVWGLRNLASELGPMYPDILQRLPPVAYRTEVYGRHWDVLERLLGTLREERAAGAQQELRMAEMGVACGPIGFHLLLRFPELVYHGADPTITPAVYESYRRFGSRASLHAVTSEELHSSLPEDLLFDFVFIDGPHTYQNVRRDIRLWQPRVRPGGILAGHDFTCAHPPLLWAVLESRLEAGGGEVNVGTDGVWWWRVP